MTGTKHLPAWMHQQIIEVDRTWGAGDAFRKRAKLSHETFKRLVSKGYGRTHVICRVISVIEADKGPVHITANMISSIVEQRSEQIISLLTANIAKDAVPCQLKAWLMHEQDMKRRDIAAELGYKSVSNVNHARQSIRNEMDVNRDFENLVFEIEEELERMGRKNN